MNSSNDQTFNKSINHKQQKQKQTIKYYLKTSLKKLEIQEHNLNGKGTSIGKYCENNPYNISKDKAMMHSNIFESSRSVKEIPLINGKKFTQNSSGKLLKKVQFKNIKEENRNQLKQLNIFKQPINIETKSITECLKFSQGRKVRSKKSLKQIHFQESTEFSNNSNTFKTKPQVYLSQFITKDSHETSLQQSNTSETVPFRRRSLNEQNMINNNEGDFLNNVSATFSNSCPINTPFLKFKETQKKLMTKSKIFSSKNIYNFLPSNFENRKQFHSQKDIAKLKKSSIQIGCFQIGKKLGKGKYGNVFLVKHKQLGFICAMKIIEKDLVKKQEVQNQISREMKITNYIRHSNVTSLYGYFHDSNNVYLLIQLCSQGNLYSILKKRRRLSQNIVVTGIKQICQGIQYLHSQNIIHRDIKPQNIIIQNGFLKLCDFGWAVYCDDKMRTTFCGTPLYLSPQMLKGQEYSKKIDIWAIGILTYELLIGRIPFRINNESDMVKIIHQQIQFPSNISISDIAKDFILQILDKNPQNRIDIEQILNHPFLKQQCSEAFLLQ